MTTAVANKKKKWWVLFVTTCGTSLVFLDNTVMPVALPTIERQFNFSPVSLVWVVNSYLLSLTAFLLVGGRLSDLLGKRRLFVWGLSCFGIGSLVSALSFARWALILGRVIQGVGGALTIPTTSALLISNFPLGERAKAIGINTGISSVFLMLGPAVGGVLTQLISWRSIFYLNLPIVAFGIVMAYVILNSEEKKRESFDYTGAFSLTIGVSSLVIALMQGNEWGWLSPVTLSLFGLFPISIFYFLWKSTHTKHPLINLAFFKIRAFSFAALTMFLVQVVVMVTVIWAIYFQNELHYTPIETGMIIFTATLPVFLMAPFGGYLGDRYGTRIPLLIGFSILTFGLFWLLITIARAEQFLFLLPGLLAFGTGVPMIFSPAVALGLSHVPAPSLGSASAITISVRQIASTTGMAMLIAVFYTVEVATGSHIIAFQVVSLIAGCFAILGLLTALFFKVNS